jgi:hypothetical protein
MANEATFKGYQNSGFSDAADIDSLQGQKLNIPISENDLHQQAVNQYADTYNVLDNSFSQQLSALITSQANDEKLLNEQYNNSITAMMAKLQKRGLQTTAALPGAQTAALNKHRNETLAVRHGIYAVQRELPEKRQKLLKTNYDLEIQKRIAENRQVNLGMATDLLTSISEIQFSSYEDYVNYIQAKKAKEEARRRRYRSYSRSSGSSSYGNPGSNGYVNPGDLSGNGGTFTGYYTPYTPERRAHTLAMLKALKK